MHKHFELAYHYARFFIAGGSGVLLNLAVTWFFTTFVFGLHGYFTAFLIGIAVNLAYTFTLYSVVIFRSAGNHTRRFIIFVLYSLAMTYVQASIVKAITPIVGTEFYLLVIAGVAIALSFVNFFVFKLSIFKETDSLSVG